MSEPRNHKLARVRGAARSVELRMRTSRALTVLPSALTLALAVAAVTIAVRKTAPALLSEPAARLLLVAAAVSVVLAVLVSMLRRLPPAAGTLALDKHHRLADRLTSAVAFEALPPADRTALMEAAIDDACEHATALAPRKAAPLRLPWDLSASVVAGLGVAALLMLEVRTPIDEPTITPLDALAMAPDDIELFKDAAKALDHPGASPEVKAAIERFNQLITDIADRRLDRTEAFRQMEAIERELLQGAEADAKALEEALKQTGEDLKSSDLARKTGESLEKNDLDQASREIKSLADRLRNGDKKKVDKAELDRLREALEKAAARRKEALASVNEKRSELQENLLKKKQQARADAGAPDAEEERLLRKKERELERLDREAEQKEREGRQLDRLDRELAKAAEDLLRDLGAAADDLDQAAEDIHRMENEAMTDSEKEELRQRLEELRELLRQQGQGGKERMSRMIRFGKRARGGSQGQEGQEPGQDGDGKGEQPGKNGEGQGSGPGGQELVIGRGDKTILMPGRGPGAGQPGEGQGPGEGKGEGNSPGGDGTEPGGHGVGSGHDPNVAGKRTDLKAGTRDVEAQGLDSKEGPTNSQVILGAAERGFQGTPYKKVFTDYHTVAEQQIEKDEVPDGYRFYVRRYFQLIRPRE